MRKAALFFLTVMLTGSMMTGCSLDRMAKKEGKPEKSSVSVVKKEVTPTEKPKSIEEGAQTFEEQKETSGTENGQTEQEKNQDIPAEPSQTAEPEEIPLQGWDSIVLYDIDMNSVQVQYGNDGTGNWYDENGVSYGNLYEADESQPIENENGEIYYWNGIDAEAAAREQNGTGEEDPMEQEVNDPYDLYTWDARDNSYIPYQQADSDGSPVGKGNGWYYYNEEKGEYLPW